MEYIKKRQSSEKNENSPTGLRGKPLSEQIPNSSLEAIMAGRAHAGAKEMGHRQDLAPSLNAKMSKAFGMDFSGIQLYRTDAMQDTEAKGMASGNKVVLSADIDLNTTAGQALLGHELSHVRAQSRGIGMGHSGLYQNAGLEHQADMEGMMAARGQSILGENTGMDTGLGMGGIGGLAPLGPGMSASAGAPMQAGKFFGRNQNRPENVAPQINRDEHGNDLSAGGGNQVPKAAPKIKTAVPQAPPEVINNNIIEDEDLITPDFGKMDFSKIDPEEGMKENTDLPGMRENDIPDYDIPDYDLQDSNERFPGEDIITTNIENDENKVFNIADLPEEKVEGEHSENENLLEEYKNHVNDEEQDDFDKQQDFIRKHNQKANEELQKHIEERTDRTDHKETSMGNKVAGAILGGTGRVFQGIGTGLNLITGGHLFGSLYNKLKWNGGAGQAVMKGLLAPVSMVTNLPSTITGWIGAKLHQKGAAKWNSGWEHPKSQENPESEEESEEENNLRPSLIYEEQNRNKTITKKPSPFDYMLSGGTLYSNDFLNNGAADRRESWIVSKARKNHNKHEKRMRSILDTDMANHTHNMPDSDIDEMDPEYDYKDYEYLNPDLGKMKGITDYLKPYAETEKKARKKG